MTSGNMLFWMCQNLDPGNVEAVHSISQCMILIIHMIMLEDPGEDASAYNNICIHGHTFRIEEESVTALCFNFS